ncbi:hypothetical+protein [Methylocapsa aurea]
MFGVSLYEHSSRLLNCFDFVVIREDEIYDLLEVGSQVIIINICLPEHFLRVEGAVNVGYFFWETEKFPLMSFWLAHLKLMDRIWSPSTWQSAFMREVTGRTEIPVVPWPQSTPKRREALNSVLTNVRAHREMNLAQLQNYHLRASPPGRWEDEKAAEARAFEAGVDNRFDPVLSPSIADIIELPGDRFLSVQTDAPRKGLAMLFTAWLQFKKSAGGRDAKLLIKLSSIDVSADLYRVHFHTSLALRRARQRMQIEESGVRFVYERLDDEQLEMLLLSSDALVSATYGEGFGGPIAEALIHGVPVIAPNHTSAVDLLGEDYPLAVASAPHSIALWQNIPIYSPSAVWHIADDRSFAEKLNQFAKMREESRREVAARARETLLARAGVAAASQIIANEFEIISGIWPGIPK